MENIFSLTEAKILSEQALSPKGDGFFFLYQLSQATEILCEEEATSPPPSEGIIEKKFTLSPDEVFVGELKNKYTLLPSAEGSAIYVLVDGELMKSLSRLYGICNGFLTKAPESREIFEEIRLSFSAASFTESVKALKQSLALHRLIHVLRKSSYTRLVRRTSLRIKDYIDSHLEEKTDLDTLASVFFMSRTQIHRLFKEEYGIPPIKYLTKCRVELSKNLLKNESSKLSEIAERLCFSDAKHFSKTFFKHEGILPSEYRKNKK